jgi:hypothetical protein
MITIDSFETLVKYYKASAKAPEIVDLPSCSFLMIDGRGDPNSAPEYAEALDALYAMAYGLKFGLKKRGVGPEYKVPALEGLWWADDMAQFSIERRDDWQWTMMIAQPDHITPDLLAEIVAEAEGKGKPAAVRRVRLEPFDEGLAAQILHSGPYAAEAPTIAKLHAFIEAQGYDKRGKHHEIYLGDPRRTAPEKLRTIIRQPIGSR